MLPRLSEPDRSREWVGQLYVDYGFTIHQRCLRMLGNKSEAEDALQDAFARVLRYRKSFKGDRPLAWLIRISDRVCYDRWKRNSRQNHEADEKMSTELVARDTLGDFERSFLVAQLAAGSSAAVRHSAVLYYVDGMTQEEIAGHLECSRKVVRKHLETFNTQAKKRLNSGGQNGGKP